MTTHQCHQEYVPLNPRYLDQDNLSKDFSASLTIVCFLVSFVD
jgi:hypothetical protein